MLDSSRVKLVQLEATVASVERTVEQLRKDVCMMKADWRLAKAMKGNGEQSIANPTAMGEEEQASTMTEAPAAEQLHQHEQHQRLRALEAACAQLRTGLSEVGCLAERTEESGAQLKQEIFQLREQLDVAHSFRQESVRTAILGGSTAAEGAEAEAGGGPPPQLGCGLSAADLSRAVLDLQEALLFQQSEFSNLQRHIDSAVKDCSPDRRVEDCSSECGLDAACAEFNHGQSGGVFARLEALEVKSAALRCNDMALCALRERMDKLAFLQDDLSNTRVDVADLHWRVRNLEDRSTTPAGKANLAPSDVQLSRSRSRQDIHNMEAVEDDAKAAMSTTMRQETKLDEAMVRLSHFCKELNALRTETGTTTVGERALAADAAVNSKLDDVRGLLSSCLHHLRNGNAQASSVADAVAEAAPATLSQRLPPQHQQLQQPAASNVKRGASTSAAASSSAACNRRPTSHSAGMRAATLGEQRRASPSRTRQQQSRSPSRAVSPARAPGSPGSSQRPRRRPSANLVTQEVRDEQHASSPYHDRERSTSIPLESHNPMASPSAAGVPSGMSRNSGSLLAPAGSSTVVTAASSRRACVAVSRGRTSGTLTAKH